MEMKFWAVLDSRGCREKKPPDCHKYMQLFERVFQLFVAKKEFLTTKS